MESEGTGPKRKNPHRQNRRQTGQWAEGIAAAALEQAGYMILDRNWHCLDGEIDLVARHRGEIVIIEVRARSGSEGIDTALESIGKAKQARLIRLAYAYLGQHQLDDVPFRIDVVAIGLSASPPTVEIIESAVGW